MDALYIYSAVYDNLLKFAKAIDLHEDSDIDRFNDAFEAILGAIMQNMTQYKEWRSLYDALEKKGYMKVESGCYVATL